jgi:hypothetical protein
MSTINKTVWALGLLCVFLFVLLTGRTNLRNFEKVRDSIEEIYEDRLVVKGLIFELSSLLHRKEIANISRDQAFYRHLNESVNTQIAKHLEEFRATKLTLLEEKTLDHLAASIDELKVLENELGLAEDFDLSSVEERQLADRIASLNEDLRTLSKIQLAEGRRRVGISDKAVESMNTFARIENYMMLLCAVVMLALVFAVPNARKDRSADPPRG